MPATKQEYQAVLEDVRKELVKAQNRHNARCSSSGRNKYGYFEALTEVALFSGFRDYLKGKINASN